MDKKCEKAFMNGTLMFGPRGGEYILVKSRNKKGKCIRNTVSSKSGHRRIKYIS